MAPRTGTIARKPPTTDTSTRKRFRLTYRMELESGGWDFEEVEMTAFLVTPSGALTLFLYKMPQRCLAAGYWSDLTLLSADTANDDEEEDAEEA